MASAPGAPPVCSMRTIKSDVVVGLDNDDVASKLDDEEPGWKISGKYVCIYFLYSSQLIYILVSGRCSVV